MKTIREHFDNLHEHERALALANTEEGMLNIEEDTLSASLVGAFDWEKSPEGLIYWQGINNREWDKEALSVIEAPSENESIAFLEWVTDNDYIRLSGNLWYAMSDGNLSEGIHSEELFNKFLNKP